MAEFQEREELDEDQCKLKEIETIWEQEEVALEDEEKLEEDLKLKINWRGHRCLRRPFLCQNVLSCHSCCYSSVLQAFGA